MIKENYMYVGIDLHKETHTAVIYSIFENKKCINFLSVL